jgi:hypothetical protein
MKLQLKLFGYLEVSQAGGPLVREVRQARAKLEMG